MSQTGRSGRRWWSTWPGALALGLVALVMVVFTAGGLVLLALLSPPDGSAMDTGVESGPSLVARVVWLLLGLAALALPVVVVVMARRLWLGWTLTLLAVCALILAAGLGMLGIL